MILERDVARAVLDHYAREPGYRVAYNTDGHYGDIESYPKHNIRIAGRYPDILALGPGDRVIATEVKRPGGNLMEALGQALTYRSGTPLSYIALDANDVHQVRDTAMSAGLGVISVSGSRVVRVDEPPQAYVATIQHDLLRELRILLVRQGPELRLTAMMMNHPLHYLAPLFRNDYPMSEAELRSWLAAEESWGLGAGSDDHAFRGARALNLIEVRDGQVFLRETGRFLQSMLRHSGHKWTVQDVRSLTRSSSGLLCQAQPFLTGLVRIAFSEVDDISTVLEALRQNESETMLGLLTILAQHYPNAFLNIFMTEKYHQEGIQLMIRREFDKLLEPAYVREWLSSFVRMQLKRQLQHAGFLASGRGGLSLHDRREGYDPSNDIWRPVELHENV